MGGELIIPGRNKRLLRKLDAMLDEAIAGTFQAQSYDESLLSKIEWKTARFLEQSRRKQQQIDDERRQVRSLIGDISHQVKTPLANIALYTQLLAEGALSEEQAKLAEQIAVSSEKLNFLIQSLVKTSRLESGAIKIEPKPCNIRETVCGAAAGCESAARAKNIALSVGGGAPLGAMLDARWCAEALYNIIENAVKYTPENGRVTVSVMEYEMFARVDVADTGRGISGDDLTNVFGRFWRAPESADTPGAGIGLYLAREIVTACGGFIRVSSEAGQGSTFSLFFQKCKI